MSETKEFRFTDRDFRFISQLLFDRTGITMSASKRDLVYSRLVRRLRQYGMTRFEDYCALLKDGDAQELVEFVNALTTNLTRFFREPHHFQYLRETVLPELMANKRERRLRLWSAGCSSGEEAYSLAVVVREAVPSGWDVRILATDLDSAVLSKAKRGVYEASSVTHLDSGILKRWFKKGTGINRDDVKVASALQDLISFKQLNLMTQWPMKGHFDVIFCRNVVIYFSKETQRVLFDRFANQLDNSGLLFVGHSESLYRVTDRFEPLGNTIYRKK